MTKLLLGRPPRSPTPTAGEVRAASELVPRLAFVGLSECFNESIALFRAALPGPRVEQQYFRIAPRSGAARQQDECLLLRHGFADPEDDAIYARAARLFHARRASAGIPILTPGCAATVPQSPMSYAATLCS